MTTLWDKGYQLDQHIARYTVGEDSIYDTRLIPADCVGTMAHARVLERAALLSHQQCDSIIAALHTIIAEYREGTFRVTESDEDCHTAIENRLSALIGEVGATIHTGRSRNDQVFTALLLYGRMRIYQMERHTQRLISSLLTLAEKEEYQFMVGRTHLQPAMPSTVGLWAASFADQLIAMADDFELLYRHTNRSPLGAAAGYGIALPLDRELAARLLGFEQPIHTVLGAINSRGHWESRMLDCATHIMLILSRLAEDLLLFTLPELNYMSLPEELCSGSSIMPHKRNPDLLELLRAKSAIVAGYAAQSKEIMRALPSGYNRDVQEIKGLYMRGMDITDSSLEALHIAISQLHINHDVLDGSVISNLFSVDRALHLVAQGKSFRSAYRQVAATNANTNELPGELKELLQARSSLGAPGNLQLKKLRQQWRERWRHSESHYQAWREAIEQLAGSAVDI